MKVVVFLFLWMHLFALDLELLAQERITDEFKKGIAIQQDATDLDLNLQKRIYVLKRESFEKNQLLQNEVPVIRQAPLSPRRYRPAQSEDDMERETSHGLLPQGVSLSGIQDRLAATMFWKRAARRERELSYI